MGVLGGGGCLSLHLLERRVASVPLVYMGVQGDGGRCLTASTSRVRLLDTLKVPAGDDQVLPGV